MSSRMILNYDRSEECWFPEEELSRVLKALRRSKNAHREPKVCCIQAGRLGVRPTRQSDDAREGRPAVRDHDQYAHLQLCGIGYAHQPLYEGVHRLQGVLSCAARQFLETRRDLRVRKRKYPFP